LPQNGLHGLFGLGVARVVAPRLLAQQRQSAAVPFVTGTTLGAMLPDVDMYPTAIVFLMGRGDLIYVMHRTATHSVFLVLLLTIIGVLLLRLRRGRRPVTGWACLGLALGMSTHILLDTFFWFAQIDLFWPLSHLPAEQPLLPILDLWQGAKLDPLVVNLREAGEFAAFALLLRALRHIAARQEESAPGVSPRSLNRWETAAWVGFGVALVGAVLFRDAPKFQNVLVTAPSLLAFLPFCWLSVYRLRHALAHWACGQSREKVVLSTEGVRR